MSLQLQDRVPKKQLLSIFHVQSFVQWGVLVQFMFYKWRSDWDSHCKVFDDTETNWNFQVSHLEE